MPEGSTEHYNYKTIKCKSQERRYRL